MKNFLFPRCVSDTTSATHFRNLTIRGRSFFISVTFFVFPFPLLLFSQTSSSGAANKSVDIPVSYHTGVPNISVRITSVSEGELSLGVSLNYNSSGIKVDELASPVGLGWALNAGGMISRQVVGGVDERSGFYSFYGIRIGLRDGETCAEDPNCLTGFVAGVPPACGLGDCKCLCNYPYNVGCDPCHAILEQVHNETNDVEPDIFTFNFGGYSGKFTFGNDNTGPGSVHTIHMLQANDLSVDFSNWDTQHQFIITDPKDVKYYFGNFFGRNAYEEVTPDYIPGTASPHITSSAWYLVRVESPDGRHFIDLDYNSENYSYSTQGQNFLTVDPQSGLPNFAVERDAAHSVTTNAVTGVRIKNISTSSGIYSVNFGVGTPRSDLSSNAINQITVTNGTYCKNFNLSQSYFIAAVPSAGGNDGTRDTRRLRLDQVQEVSCDGSTSVPPYIFSYNATPVPPRSSLAKDLWGYYNGKDSNKGLFPIVLPNILNLLPTDPLYSANGNKANKFSGRQNAG